MSRYIDADKLNIDFYDEYETEDDEYTYRYVSEHQIDDAPSIDICFCRECKMWMSEHLCQWWSRYGTVETDADDFCSYGEREGE